MTRKLVVNSCFALTLLNFFLATQAFAHDPVEVFRECATEVRKTARICVNQNHNNADRCVRIIRELLEQGHIDRAHAVADHCIEAIQDRTERCIDRINEICVRCVRRLNELGAERLAERMKTEVCKDARVAVTQSGRRAIRRIENLFD